MMIIYTCLLLIAVHAEFSIVSFFQVKADVLLSVPQNVRENAGIFFANKLQSDWPNPMKLRRGDVINFQVLPNDFSKFRFEFEGEGHEFQYGLSTSSSCKINYVIDAGSPMLYFTFPRGIVFTTPPSCLAKGDFEIEEPRFDLRENHVASMKVENGIRFRLVNSDDRNCIRLERNDNTGDVTVEIDADEINFVGRVEFEVENMETEKNTVEYTNHAYI